MTHSLSNNNKSKESLQSAKKDELHTETTIEMVTEAETPDVDTVSKAIRAESDTLRIAIFGEPHAKLSKYENNAKNERRNKNAKNTKHKKVEGESLQSPFSRQVHQVYFVPNIKGPQPEEYGAEVFVYNPKSRNSFIRRVMLMLFVALLFTTAVLIFVNTNDEVAARIQPYSFFMFIACLFGSFAVFYAMVCTTCGRMPPCSYILFVIGTLLYTGFAAMMTIHYHTFVLTIASVATVAVVMLCLGLAFTSFDFTRYYLVVVVISMALGGAVIAVFVLRIYYDLKFLSLIIAIAIAVVQAVALVITMQMMLGGKSVRYGVDDHVLVAYTLYTSIVTMFLRLAYILNHFME